MVDLRNYLKSSGHPVLCIGPMSKNSVDAVIEYANRIRRPIPLIASRRQIDCAEFGGGYVNHWDTQKFASYVKRRDEGYVPVCRDHGGPWQGANEGALSTLEAVKRAKISIEADLRAGFDIIHIDPCADGKELSEAQVLELIFDIYAFTIELAQELGQKVEIEIGSEQQSGHFSDTRELVSFLKAITQFCEKHDYKKPLFCVVQTGTLVREMRNIGLTEGRRNEEYDQKYAVEQIEKSLRYLVDIAYINGVFVKEHNGDYLSDGTMRMRHQLGVGGVNVAPELGVMESKCLVNVCVQFGLNRCLDKMLRVFYDSKKWEKWLSVHSDASDFDKAIIAGHYTFSSPEFREVLKEIRHEAGNRSLNVDEYIKDSLIAMLSRFFWNLGYLHSVVGFENRVANPNFQHTQLAPQVLCG